VFSLMRSALNECRVKRWVPLLTTAWLLFTPVHASASNSHALMTRMALGLSDRQSPCTRDDLRRSKPGIPDKPSANSPLESIRPAPSAGA
jgi:hypothetical protein